MEEELNYLSERIEEIGTQIDYSIKKYGLTGRVDSNIEEKVLLESILNYITSHELK